MNKLFRGFAMLGTSLFLVSVVQGCIDKDYDLDKDIDMTIGVGGNMLTIPSSSTSNYSLSQILDLDDDSSIKPDANGDYVLSVDGNRTSSTFKIDEVNLHQLSGNRYAATVNFPTIPSGITIPGGKLKVVIGDGASDTQWDRALAPFDNSVNIAENNIDHAIVSVSEVKTDIALNFGLSCVTTNYNGQLVIENGFTIDFDPAFTVELSGAGDFCEVRNGHTIVFTADKAVTGAGLNLPVKITKITLGMQGLDSNHNFSFNAGIKTTGTLSIAASGIVSGTAPKLEIVTTSNVSSAKIVSAKGIVNPRINIDDIEFSITDIPDFLREDGNVLDIANPCVYLTVNNTSDVSVAVEAVLTGYLDNAPVSGSTVRIDGNNCIVVNPGLNKICISRLGGVAGWTNVVVPDLANVIRTIPDNIRIKCSAAVVQREAEFRLGEAYAFDIDNEVVAPLSFGPDLRFTYSDSDDGWDEDLEDYNFSSVVITIEAENTIPLKMKPEVTPIFKQGYSQTVEVTVNGEIGGGTLANPSTSKLTIELKGIGKNLDGLDGIEYLFHATSPATGATLNENQSMKFTNISLAIKGGLTVDLN